MYSGTSLPLILFKVNLIFGQQNSIEGYRFQLQPPTKILSLIL